MRLQFPPLRSKDSILKLLLLLIIAVGVVLRLAMFLHNRNLIIDEANIVRNLAERNFAGLAHPLRYEQYAPPVFLWIEKLASMVVGYGEQAMRFYALLCGLSTLAVFYIVAQKMLRKEAMWLPLAYLAFGFIFIKYSAEVKQYMPDAFIALLLIWLALRWDIMAMKRWRFVAYWAIAGSVAIWSSMPSVFILAGVGCYYGWIVLRGKRYDLFLSLCLMAGVWLLQFALYYFIILKQQINSTYLQSFHQEYFLFATPSNKDEWLHNWGRIEDIMGNVGGWSGEAIGTNLVFLVVGCVWLARKRFAQFLLIAMPIGLVLIAAALKQFSLIDRVILFMLPLWVLLIGVGFQTLWNLKLPMKILLVIVGCYNAWAYGAFHLLRQPYEAHEITQGMDWVAARGGRGAQLYVHNASVPTYIYYTELHPQKAKWAQLLGAHQLGWDSDYTAVTAGVKDTAYFLYTGGFPDGERDRRTKQIEQNMRQIGYFEHAICFAFAYVPKSVTGAASQP